MKLWLIAAIVLVASPHTPPQSHSAKEVNLRLVSPQMIENGELIYDGGGECGGNVIAIHLALEGWIVLSAEPHAGYHFQKIGKTRGERISFRLDSRAYEIVSQKDIEDLEAGREPYELWMVRITSPDDTDQKLDFRKINE